MSKKIQGKVVENNKYESTYTHEPLNTYTPSAFIKIREVFGCKPLTKKTPDKNKLKKQKEKFTDKYVCPYCNNKMTWISDTNLMVCQNPECSGNELKKSDGTVFRTDPSFVTLSHRGESIASTLLSE